jgi:tetratricopeptide (TPR) repeat protein
MLHHGRTGSILISSALLAALAGCSPNKPLPVLREHGESAYASGNYAEAVKNYEEFVGRKPGDAAVECEYAKALIKNGQASKAIEHAQIAYDQQPNSEEYGDTLAEAYMASGRTDELFKFLRGNTEGRGTVSDYIRLGKFMARQGDADGAELALVTAARLDQGRNIGPQVALADFYKSINDKSSEKKRLRMALYLDPESKVIADRLRALGEIPGPSLRLRPDETAAVITPVKKK